MKTTHQNRGPEHLFEAVKCYACGSSDSHHFLEANDDYTGRPGVFTYVRCAQCELVYQNPRVRLDQVKAYYDDAYLSHQKSLSFGALTPAVRWALSGHDRKKAELVERHMKLDSSKSVLDVGCARGTFLKYVQGKFKSRVTGVDFVDTRAIADFEGVNFYNGLFYEQDFGNQTFDVITMWHFLEHCYDPVRSLETGRDLLSHNGILVLEVPDLDSKSFKAFGRHWPGVQAPQHTILFDRKSFPALLKKAGLTPVESLQWGAFPPFFYFYMGAAFKVSRGSGFDVRKHLPSYFASQLATWPVFQVLNKKGMAMQVIVCRKG